MNDEVIEFQKTALHESNITILKRMFKDDDSYIEYMNTLYALRQTSWKVVEHMGLDKLDDDQFKDHPNGKAFLFLNQLVGALLNSSFDWDTNGNFIKRTSINTKRNEKKQITIQCE